MDYSSPVFEFDLHSQREDFMEHALIVARMHKGIPELKTHELFFASAPGRTFKLELRNPYAKDQALIDSLHYMNTLVANLRIYRHLKNKG